MGHFGLGSRWGRATTRAQWVPRFPLALTGAAALAVGDDAAEVPEAGLAAVALEASHAGFAGALAGGGVAGPSVGAVGITLAGACRSDRETPTPQSRGARIPKQRRTDVPICAGPQTELHGAVCATRPAKLAGIL